MFACPCCGYLTLNSAPPGTFEICPVCYWEDDAVQFDDPDYAGGANAVSLNEARANFKNFGAISREFTTRTRRPKPEEFPLV
ncbi:CPCC family cysteine-rich protein [Calidithermus chliarophilus]|uniref:CPCC family cysteine-rich protein n=1 Tax=Calidithermus chliarophilus TaxID=52023 RepID=UPI0009FCCC15|nr:CPCC family cysteine-rich protein [Calidithermus chliarophilus]